MATPVVPSDSQTVDFGRCFGFVVKDPDWIKKVLIGGAFVLLSMVIVGLFFVAGYWVRVLRRVAAGDPLPLPEWDDLGGIFSDGLKLVGAYFAYLRHPFPGRTAREVAERLAKERGVLALPGSYFGPGQESHLRVAFANVGTEVLAGLGERLRGF